MATTITQIIALIQAKVVALHNGTAPIFGDVFTYANGDFTKFPTAEIVESGGRGEVIDTHRNQRTHQFVIRLYQEQSKVGKNKQQASVIMREAADAILLAFDIDKDLGGQVDIVRVVEYDLDFKVAAGTFNFATFRIDAVVLVSNN